MEPPATGANSAGCVGRLIGYFWPNCVTCSFGIVAGIKGVHTGPGATLLTRMPLSATNCANPPVKFTIAALVAEYASVSASAQMH
ncbi:MAG TPA: hypothetical protein V6D11_02110 [Waterburya sp.]